MSLQINLSSREIYDAYQNVVDANGIDWAIFTYEKGSNDLKVQATGNGGLEELEEEFSDGRCACSLDLVFDRIQTWSWKCRIQYAFARVQDPNVRPLSDLFLLPRTDISSNYSEQAPQVRPNQLVW